MDDRATHSPRSPAALYPARYGRGTETLSGFTGGFNSYKSDFTRPVTALSPLIVLVFD